MHHPPDFLMLIVFFTIYLFPSVMAGMRAHRNGASILLLNVFLGWTLLGWVGALIWAATDNTEKKVDTDQQDVEANQARVEALQHEIEALKASMTPPADSGGFHANTADRV